MWQVQAHCVCHAPSHQPAALTAPSIRCNLVTSPRAIKGASRNFLGTYTSRYSDYDGYWLFGQIVDKLADLHTDLVVPHTTLLERTPLLAVSIYARIKFADQVHKAGMALSSLREANLRVNKSKLAVTRLPPAWSSGSARGGYDVQFMVTVRLVSGRAYSAGAIAFVAPHNPSLEQRRHPFNWGNK